MLSLQHMSYLYLNFVRIRKCSDIFKRQKSLHGNEERSEKIIIFGDFQAKRKIIIIITQCPFFTEIGLYTKLCLSRITQKGA